MERRGGGGGCSTPISALCGLLVLSEEGPVPFPRGQWDSRVGAEHLSSLREDQRIPHPSLSLAPPPSVLRLGAGTQLDLPVPVLAGLHSSRPPGQSHR